MNKRFGLAFLFALTAIGAARAQPVVATDHATTRLVAEADGIAPGGSVALAFAQELEQGWHVYWKNQGDSGLPLEFNWTLPDGASAGPIDYPTPERIPIGPLVNFGHEGAPIFLTSVTAPSDAAIGSVLEIGLEATWLICADICVPETGRFSLSLPVVANPAATASARPLFAAARAAMPEPFDSAASFSARGDGLTLELASAPNAAGAYFFPDLEGVSDPAAAQRFERQGDAARLTIKGGPSLAALGGRLDGVIIFDERGIGRGYAIAAERKAAIAQGPAAPAGSLAGLLITAFLGGALLNLMPCVFPILFIKAASMAKAATGDRGKMRRHGVLYALGVVATFAALGGTLLALRAGGEQLGWGFHLQSPAVVALSAYVLFAVGLNLAGAFHVGSGLQDIGSGLVRGRNGDVSAFLTGVLAVFVAAPCVGPFLTAPVGAAAVLPPMAGMSIFIAMALGLAAPYAAISFAPGVARALPRPGPWMERFRQALSFPVFAAAAYFLWVLAAQTGGRGLALAFSGLLLLALASRLWEWGRGARWGAIAAATALALALAPVTLLRPAETASAAGVIAFDPADIARRRAAGEPIFVDFTAAWCVTCQVNKLTVLASPAVKDAFRAAGVAVITADWTNRDPTIENALAAFGANGVPLYVFYPPGGGAVVLPQPLSERSILSALSPTPRGE